MGLLIKKQRANKIKHADTLPLETKVALINALDMVKQTREAMREEGGGLDLTCRFQLNSDISAVEKAAEKADSPRSGEKELKELETALIRLQTSAGNILDL